MDLGPNKSRVILRLTLFFDLSPKLINMVAQTLIAQELTQLGEFQSVNTVANIIIGFQQETCVMITLIYCTQEEVRQLMMIKF